MEREIPCHFSVSQCQAGQWWPDHGGDELKEPYQLMPRTDDPGLRSPTLSPVALDTPAPRLSSFPSMPSLAEETRHKGL